MVVHDFGYRAYEGERTSSLTRCFELAKSEVKRAFKGKRFLLFYIFCITPAILRLVLLYVHFVVQGDEQGSRLAARMGNRGFWSILAIVDQPEFYFNAMLAGTMVLVLMFSAVAISGIVAKDRAENALELYFTRGITPLHYIIAKWAAAFFLMLCQLLFPILAVWILGVYIAPDWQYFADTVGFMPNLILGLSFFCASLAFLATALSTSTDSPRFALMRWFGAFMLLSILGTIIWQVFEKPELLVVSPWHVLTQVAAWLADVEIEPGPDTKWAWLAWLGMMVLAAFWMRMHLKPVEVVG